MSFRRSFQALVMLAPALLALLAVAAPAFAQSGSFLVRLGTDTTSVEKYAVTGQKIEVEQVGRVPRVLHRKFTFDLGANGATTHAAATVVAPSAAAGSPPFQLFDATVMNDSVIVSIKQDTSLRTLRVAIPAGTMIASNASPWGLYETQTMKLAAAKKDSLRVPLYQLGAGSVSSLFVGKLGKDSMIVQTLNDRYHAKVNAKGEIQGVRFVSGTQGYNVTRIAKLDVPATAAAWAAREKSSGAMGQLSTRDTTRANLGGAAMWVDYSRPSKRGRVIFGELVPYGQVWRTGANSATQFKTDKSLQIGGVALPAGVYSLFTIPNATEWTLIINSETGQPGTSHNAAKDVQRIRMKVSALVEPVERFTIGLAPSAEGGVLFMEWDRTRAEVPFTVTP